MLTVPHPVIRPEAALTEHERLQVRDVHVRALEVDGVSPLSEQSLLSLDSPPGRVRHFLSYAGSRLVGYAQLDDAGSTAASGELVVDPSSRRRGVGRGLLEAVLGAAPEARVWSHGHLVGAQVLARSAGLSPVRDLHKMARPLSRADTEASATALPPGFSARPFEPGRDEAAWLSANAAAFSHHPEQGRLTVADLQERMGQPWFDPSGLILVEAGEHPGKVAAFHWTKVDPAQRSTLDASATAGEVYVVGVHPAYQGRGLGRPVTALGLAHLAGLGLPEVVLYVDGDNEAAMRTYTRLGFRSIMVDVMYSRTGDRPLSG
ncbi:mycothiol synthase [Pedococcus sp. 5OH_020]|uniref:mycothiol synthase n=1 Tax=Pedococcus sp. 5OH_020 TaxID=2989814 RepID=UPI0022E9E635|nr:mycothiol synthase [Pedococcus sp. 5OH_020]